MARIGELLNTLLRRRTPDGDPLADAVLLERFARGRDQAAFELLVWRHGPMVLATCRRVLRDSHAAEDAFQAAFLVLSRKAGAVRGSAAGWLHRVALRVCLRMKRRLPAVSLDAEPTTSPHPDAVEAAEQSAILDDEIARLPEWLRLPVILCHLQGHSTEHAAAALGIPRGTVLSRLANARKRLAVQLTARGVAPAVAVAAAAELSADAGRTVAEAAAAFTVGKAVHTVPVQLALEVLSMTKRTAVAVAAGVLVLVAGLGTGIGFVTAQGQGPKLPPATAPAEKKDKPPAALTPADEKATLEQEKRLMIALDGVDRQLADAGGQSLETLREELRTAQQRWANLLTRLEAIPRSPSPELGEELAKAGDRVEAARKAPVPAAVLAEAVKLHPKVVETRKKAFAKQAEVQASKLPPDDAGRKALQTEATGLFRTAQSLETEVGPEVEGYLRAPGVVEAEKARAAIELKFRQPMEQRELIHGELAKVGKVVDELRDKLAKFEHSADEIEWLKEKRKRLKRELFELELERIGANRAK
jgi:RNA polymerase sigma factor (sigma-70 family)